jgi:alpha-L-fucosidase
MTVINGLHGDPFAPYWCPGEADFTLRWNRSFQGGWFWKEGEDHKIFTVGELMKKYETSVGRNTNMLVGIVIDNRGLVPDADRKRVEEWGKAIRERYGNPLKTTSATGTGLTLKPDQPAVIDRLVIQEDIAFGERVLEYKVEGRTTEGTWKLLSSGSNIGHKHIATFPPQKLREIKLTITKSKAEPHIKNFSVFEALKERNVR